ncbi:MAG: methyltransferase domain-containing protein [Lachnospiraceae bacterium]|nr:methyltransferase domain-containing protein [Lachnospiraceae bacterium]
MRKLTELAGWERLLKKILWAQLGDMKDKKILDFGSGEGITANYFAKDNEVVAVEPWEEMLQNRWKDYEYLQIQGDISAVAEMKENSFDVVFCHNVLEYIDDKTQIVKELCRVLKPGGMLSIVKHNRAGRVMQMAVLLDDFEKAHDLLDGKDSAASKFGAIRYYEDESVSNWEPSLKLVDSFGIRTFWDLQQKQEKHSLDEWQDKMVELEMRVSQMEEFRAIAFFHHLVFEKE